MNRPFDPIRDVNLFVEGRIQQHDADRQLRTAVELNSRLKQQPGVVLADEVGMGKTFVALATAAMCHFTDPKRRPVVVMVPPALAKKWPRDAGVFRDRCLKEEWRSEFRFPTEPIDSGTEFLKTLDDPIDRRNAVLFVKHGAFSRCLLDPWIKLAILRKSMHGRHGNNELKEALSRSAGELLRATTKPGVEEEAWAGLLQRDPNEWLTYLQRNFPKMAEQLKGDDPVPHHLWEALNKKEFKEELRSTYDTLTKIPRRNSSNYEQRISSLRLELKQDIESVWALLKGQISARLPLLIFDEAHHLKNAQTKLVQSLFVGSSDDVAEINGAFFGVFEKMLMMTATPFQLGHHELINVLKLFDSVAWEKQSPEGVGKEDFKQQIADLETSLSDAQSAALRLDQTWAKLKTTDMVINGKSQATDAWWDAIQIQGAEITEASREAKKQAADTECAMRKAEILLRPWVLRHLRDREFQFRGKTVDRRNSLPGHGVTDVTKTDVGLPIEGRALLPFLLSARTVALQPRKRSLFAEGLASSYEAFLHTHKHRSVDLDSDESEDEEIQLDSRLKWYSEEISRSLQSADGEIHMEHPKLSQTVKKAIELWEKGEKVVVFCHYIETGRALRRVIATKMRESIVALGQSHLGIATPDDVEPQLQAIGDMFQKASNPIRKRFDELATKIVHDGVNSNSKIDSEEQAKIVDVMRRFVRTPGFLVRFLRLQAEICSEDIDAAFDRKDGSGQSLRDILELFIKFIDSRTESERTDYLDALHNFQTGTEGMDDEAKSEGDSKKDQRLPGVRLVNGSTNSNTRQTIMLTFNTPFSPDILVASSVMAEGVDLHLNCRVVIHHDLSWNPSSLEQRTGRVDRLGAKVEKCGVPIDVFLPYVAGTQDEKMYRVVMDRERWFKVVMGEKLKTDATSVEAMAARILLPEKLAKILAFDLSIPTPIIQAS